MVDKRMVVWSSLVSSRPVFAAVVATAAAVVTVALIFYKKKPKIFELVGEVSALYCYPIKSCAGITNNIAFCTKLGIRMSNAMDRHFLIIRENGDFITQRQIAKMAHVKTSIKNQELQLEAEGMPELRVPLYPELDEHEIIPCRIWKNNVKAQVCGDDAAAWLSTYLGEEGLRLVVYMPGVTARQSPTTNALSSDQVAFPDESPYHLTTEESLADLNKRIEHKSDGDITIENFRPNIVVKGTKEPWDEDTWAELKIGKDVRLRVLEPCGRCTLTTVDPDKLEKRADGEPLKTLRSFRLFPEVNATAPLFAVYAGLDKGGRIKIGDPVYAVRGDGLGVKISPGI
ncbi:unnamed protein product [Lymnaea stagnalis]|uniref:MOSC domain-containing protein n=1 Tax=Lymnaea stagnalis TaxID=6523 RepID=A0AAV2IIL3_LYMST